MKSIKQYIIESNISHEDKLEMIKSFINKHMSSEQQKEIKKFVDRCEYGQIPPEALWKIYYKQKHIKGSIIYPWDKRAHYDLRNSQ